MSSNLEKQPTVRACQAGGDALEVLSDQTPSSGLRWRLFGELPKRTLKELSRFSLSYTAPNELLSGLRRDG